MLYIYWLFSPHSIKVQALTYIVTSFDFGDELGY